MPLPYTCGPWLRELSFMHMIDFPNIWTSPPDLFRGFHGDWLISCSDLLAPRGETQRAGFTLCHLGPIYRKVMFLFFFFWKLAFLKKKNSWDKTAKNNCRASVRPWMVWLMANVAPWRWKERSRYDDEEKWLKVLWWGSVEPCQLRFANVFVIWLFMAWYHSPPNEILVIKKQKWDIFKLLFCFVFISTQFTVDIIASCVIVLLSTVCCLL